MSVEFPDIPAIMDQHKQSKITVWPVRSNRASQIGDECLRKLVYYRTDWDKMTPHGLALQYIFDEGNEQEASLTTELQEALKKEGIQFIEQQKGIQIEGTEISGKIDGKIARQRQYLPTDIKSCSPVVWDNLETTKDFNKFSWTKKYPAQVLVYMYAEAEPGGILLLKNKSTGRLKQFNLVLDDWLDYVEELLVKDRLIREHMQEGTLPEKLNDPVHCTGCPFAHICGPDLSFEGIDFENDPEFEKKLERYSQLKPAASEYTKLDTEIKKTVQGRSFACGDFLVEGKWVTKNNPAKEASETKYWQKSITKLPVAG